MVTRPHPLLAAALLLILALPATARERPVILDITNCNRSDIDTLRPYLQVMQRTLFQNCRYSGPPCLKTATVYFMVAQSGEFLGVSVHDSSGNAAFDEAARQAVEQTSGFSRPPAVGKAVLIHAKFDGSLFRPRTAPPIAYGSYPQMPVQQQYQRDSDDWETVADEMGDARTQRGSIDLNARNMQEEMPENVGRQPEMAGGAESPGDIAEASDTRQFKFIPTTKLQYLSEDQIKRYLDDFMTWARANLKDILK